MAPSIEVLPPSPAWVITQRLRTRKIPEPILDVTRVIVEGLSPTPSVEDVLQRFGAAEARLVREAYRAGERDKGRLGFLVARHIFGMPVPLAWGAVPRIAHALGPGSVAPDFLAEAQVHAQAAYGALVPGEDGEAMTPWIVGGLGVVCLGLVAWLFDLPGAARKTLRS